MLERSDCALALRVLLLVGERGLEHRAVPALRTLGDVGDGHLRIPLRQTLGGGLRLRRLGGRLRRGAGPRLLADRGDLDAGQGSPEACVPLVAALGAVLADPNFRAAHVAEYLRRHVLRRGRKLAVAAAAEEQDVGVEGLALLPVQALDEEALALADDVLLPSEADDRVVLGHGSQKRGPDARGGGIVAGFGALRSVSAAPTPTFPNAEAV